MIKINLATRKQTTASSVFREGRPAAFKWDVNLDGLREIPVRKIVTLVGVAVACYFLLSSYQEDELKKLDEQIAKLNATQHQLKAEIGKTAGYEELRKALEMDEKTIKTKIEVIRQLVDGRQNPPKILLGMATGIPSDVWLTEFKVTQDAMSLKGYSAGFNQISDFMKNLGESAYFTDLKLVSTQQARDDTGAEVASFDLTARKR